MKKIILDLEVYRNYFLIGMLDLDSSVLVAMTHEDLPQLQRYLGKSPICFVTFNGKSYDLRVLKYALAHHDSENLLAELKQFSDFIILGGTKEEKDAYNPYWWNTKNIDLKEVLGGRRCPSLKKLSYRLHLPEIESLPIPPEKTLTLEEMDTIRRYNEVDLMNTRHLYHYCGERLKLREALTDMFDVDCVSLSDAQIAERVISGERRGWGRPAFKAEHDRPMSVVVKGSDYHFDNESMIKFKNTVMKCGLRFEVKYDPISRKQTAKPFFTHDGENKEEFVIDTVVPPLSFKFGGIHSIHKSSLVKGDTAFDVDVTSYYPNLILKHQVYPNGLGEKFISTYRRILEKRIEAKRQGKKTEANALKIVLNSTFGHFKSCYSALYDPLCGVSVCLNGQLSLLRLVDLCVSNGLTVLMANTDGLVTKEEPYKVVYEWEKEMLMELEVKEISKYCIKDSNNHILQYADGSLKVKGVTFAYEQAIDKQNNYPVINKAIVDYLISGIPMEKTIEECDNIYLFLGCYSKGPSIQKVKLSPSLDSEGIEVASIVRYYLSRGEINNLWRRNAKNWTRIADTEGINLLNKVNAFPSDINYDLYLQKAKDKLKKIVK